MKSEKSLLVLDLDGTITKSDNLIQFSLFMIRKKKQWKFLLFYPLVGLLKFKLIDNKKFKILYAKYILKNLNIYRVGQYVEEFLDSSSFKDSFNKEVLEFTKNYSDSEKIILSANYYFLVYPISKILGIKNHISIKLETRNGIFSGKAKGIIPYGQAKIDAIKPVLNNGGYLKTIGLGDSKSDIPLLKFLDEGYLVKYDRFEQKTKVEKV